MLMPFVLLRTFCAMLALLCSQASEKIYELFDKVTVLYAGRQIYFGTTKGAKAYFENMGFQCPSRQATAELFELLLLIPNIFPNPVMRIRSHVHPKNLRLTGTILLNSAAW